jgi:hypothetical protein
MRKTKNNQFYFYNFGTILKNLDYLLFIHYIV